MLFYIDNASFKSIAIPAISTGIYGFPKKLCADTIFEAITKFQTEKYEVRTDEVP